MMQRPRGRQSNNAFAAWNGGKTRFRHHRHRYSSGRHAQGLLSCAEAPPDRTVRAAHLPIPGGIAGVGT
jgi:hypothetical protein